MPGFRVEPRALPTSVQVPECGSTWNNTGGYANHRSVLGRVYSSVRVARKKGSSNSNIPEYDAADLRNGIEITDHNQQVDKPVSSQKKGQQEVSILLLGIQTTLGISSFHVNLYLMYVNCCAQDHGRKYKRIHYSGPLMPPGGNIEDMLKEHERHIQEAVRKARVSKGSK